MAQRNGTDFNIDPYSTSGVELAEILNRMIAAVDSCNEAATEPSYKTRGTLWLDNSGAGAAPPTISIKIYDGAQWVLIGTINITTGALTVAGVDMSTVALLDGSQDFTAEQKGIDPTDPQGFATKNYVDNSEKFIGYNYLINSNFAINQRGYVDGAATTDGQFVRDRWSSPNTSLNKPFTFNGGSLTLDAADHFIGQHLERIPSLIGKKMTLSWKGTAKAATMVENGAWKSVTSPYTFTVIDNPTYLEQIYFFAGTVSEPKLELGDKATPYEVPDPATETDKCLRYFQRIQAIGGEKTIATGYMSIAAQYSALLTYTPKRTQTPDYAISAQNILRITTSGAGIASATALFLNKMSDRVLLRGTIGTAQTVNSGCRINMIAGGYIDIDAEL